MRNVMMADRPWKTAVLFVLPLALLALVIAAFLATGGLNIQPAVWISNQQSIFGTSLKSAVARAHPYYLFLQIWKKFYAIAIALWFFSAGKSLLYLMHPRRLLIN